jgi:hypothetical protein
MSNINGTYKNDNSGSTLVISNADDSNGSFSGTLTDANVDYSVSGHYHFKNSGGPSTIIAISAFNDGIAYEAWVLFSQDMTFQKLQSMGARGNFDGTVVGLGGTFIKQ